MARFPAASRSPKYGNQSLIEPPITYEPIRNLVFYGMYATSYDPAAADVFSVNATVPLALTSAQIYETGVKQLFWDNRAEWTFAAYDITRRNVYVQTSDTTYSLAGEIATKGIELAGAVRPLQNIKLWANVALTQARYEDFNNVVDPVTGAVVSGPATRHRTSLRLSSMPARLIASMIGGGRSSLAAQYAMSETVIFRGQRHDNGRLYHGRCLCVRRHSRQGFGDPESKPCVSRSACAT